MSGGYDGTCIIKSREPAQTLPFEGGVVEESAVFDDMVFDDAIFDNDYVAPEYSGTPVVGQTVTGDTSFETAVITRIFDDHIVVRNLSGDFVTGETVMSTTFSMTLGTQATYKNEAGEPEYYWQALPTQTAMPCHIWTVQNDPNIVATTGAAAAEQIRIALPPEAIVTKFDKIVSAMYGFVGTFGIIGGIYVIQSPSGVDHYEAVLKAEATA